MRHTKLKKITLLVIIVIVFFILGISYMRIKPVSEKQQLKSKGAVLYKEKGCINCHYPNSTEDKIGPGLKGILDRETFPVSNWTATRENLKKQIIDPYNNMPSYKDRLTEKEMEQLLDYIESL